MMTSDLRAEMEVEMWYVYILWCATAQHGLRRMSESCAEFELHDRFHLADAMHFCQRGMEVSRHFHYVYFHDSRHSRQHVVRSNIRFARICFIVIWKYFCFILSTGTRIRIGSVMYRRSSSRGAIQVPQLQLQFIMCCCVYRPLRSDSFRVE